MHLEANKQQTSYRLIHLVVLKLEQGYGWCFEGQTTAWKFIETFLGVRNKQVSCGLFISSLDCNSTAMSDVFTSSNATKQ